MPFVEDVVNQEIIKGVGGPAQEALQCRNCGKTEAKNGGVLKKCMRCLKVRYCSAECQKKDWKKHRMECEEAGDYQT